MRKPKITPSPEIYKVGYARVSTGEQNLDMQVEALKRFGVLDRDIHREHVSTRKSHRPALDLAISELREGDLFVVWKLDRIARSLRDLFERIDAIKEAGASLVSLTEALDFSTPLGKVMLSVIGALAELERDLISERTRAGMAAFKERGGKAGRQPSLDAKAQAKALRLLNKGDMSKAAVGREVGVSPTTINNYFEYQPRKKLWRAKVKGK